VQCIVILDNSEDNIQLQITNNPGNNMLSKKFLKDILFLNLMT